VKIRGVKSVYILRNNGSAYWQSKFETTNGIIRNNVWKCRSGCVNMEMRCFEKKKQKTKLINHKTERSSFGTHGCYYKGNTKVREFSVGLKKWGNPCCVIQVKTWEVLMEYALLFFFRLINFYHTFLCVFFLYFSLLKFCWTNTNSSLVVYWVLDKFFSFLLSNCWIKLIFTVHYVVFKVVGPDPLEIGS